MPSYEVYGGRSIIEVSEVKNERRGQKLSIIYDEIRSDEKARQLRFYGRKYYS